MRRTTISQGKTTSLYNIDYQNTIVCFYLDIGLVYIWEQFLFILKKHYNQ